MTTRPTSQNAAPRTGAVLSNPRRLRSVVWHAAVATWLLLGGMAARGEVPPGPDAADQAPPGYRSMVAVQLAVITGKLKLIDPKIEVPDHVELRKDVEYGKGASQSLRLDLYSPKGRGRSVPGLIFIHGGAWKSGNRVDYHYYGVKFAERGYVVATVSYRLLPNWVFPAAVHDVKCAVRWMRTNAPRLGVDANQIGLVGGSAGGHLALLVGYSAEHADLEGDGGHAGVSSRVQAVVDLYGPTDLTTAYAVDHETVIQFLGGKRIAEVRPRYELASPITHVTKDDPPTLIVHGTIDDIVPVAQSDALAARLREIGVPYRFDRLTGWPHTLDLAEVTNRRCRRLMFAFFEKHLPFGSPSDGARATSKDGTGR